MLWVHRIDINLKRITFIPKAICTWCLAPHIGILPFIYRPKKIGHIYWAENTVSCFPYHSHNIYIYVLLYYRNNSLFVWLLARVVMVTPLFQRVFPGMRDQFDTHVAYLSRMSDITEAFKHRPPARGHWPVTYSCYTRRRRDLLLKQSRFTFNKIELNWN